MALKALSIFITNKCNYDCIYCNQDKKYKASHCLNVKRIADIIELYLDKNSYVNFYGGEPLIEIGKIRELVSYIIKRRTDIRFSLTTNGSLVDDEIEVFLKKKFYSLMISYDGAHAQNLRQVGSASLIRESIKRFLDCEKLKFSTNSVFIPETVGNLYSVINEISSMGVENIKTSLDLTIPWSEESIDVYEQQLYKISESDIRDKSSLYRVIKNREQGYFQCSGCDNHISVGPDGTVVGCMVFQDFVSNNPNYPGIRNYIAGRIEDENILNKINKTRKHYRRLAQYQCLSKSGFCMDCDIRDFCAICPVTLVRAAGTLTSVPEWICKIKRVEFNLRKKILSGKFG